ncbi:MAG: NAD(P)H-binding protein [Thermaceae bacterium]
MIAVIGGTGFLGRRVVETLQARGHPVLVLARREAPLPPGVLFRRVDLKREVPDLEGVKAVVYLPGIIRGSREAFYQTHVLGVERTLEGMRAHGVRRLVHISALGARRKTGSLYFETKALGEEKVEGSGLDWTILRPSLVFGPGDGFFCGVLKSLARLPLPFMPLVGDGRYPFRPIYVGDVALAVARSLEVGFLGRLDLVGPREYTLRELSLLVQRALGLRKPLLSVPVSLLGLLARLPFAPITSDQLRMLLLGNTAPLPEALSNLVGELRSLEELLPQYLPLC